MKDLITGQAIIFYSLFLSACKMPADNNIIEVKVIQSPFLWLQDGGVPSVTVNIDSVTKGRKDISIKSNYPWLLARFSTDYKSVTISAEGIQQVTGKFNGILTLNSGDGHQIVALINIPVYVFGSINAPVSSHVLLVGVCGFRPDAIPIANAPYLKTLISHSLYSLNASTQLTAITASDPGWASVLTGVEPVKHRVMNNSETAKIDRRYPTLLKWLNEKGLSTCVVTNDDEVMNIIEPDVQKFQPDIDSKLMNAAIAKMGSKYPQLKHDDDGKSDSLTVMVQLSDSIITKKTETLLAFQNYNLVFLYYAGVDITGHQSGFGPGNKLYLKAVEKMDNNIGNLLDAIMKRPNVMNEDWMIIVTADHSGEGTSHAQTNKICQTIPLIFFSPSLKNREMENASHLDVYPSVLRYLKISEYPSQLDGKNQLVN